MDLFDIDNVKSEKANAMQGFRLRKISNFFRFVEVCFALILLSWLSYRITVTFKHSSECLRVFHFIFGSPRFVFLIGNAIILTLFAKSGQFPCKNSTGIRFETDLYEEFVNNSENRQKFCTESSSSVAEEIVRQDRQIVCEESSLSHTYDNTDTVTVTNSDTDTDANICGKSQSENLENVIFEEPLLDLQQSATENCQKEGKAKCDEEEMSDEEFRQKIEAFIKKQMRFLRKESSGYRSTESDLKDN